MMLTASPRAQAATIQHLLPVILVLLKDDVPDVRLNILGNLEVVNQARACCQEWWASGVVGGVAVTPHSRRACRLLAWSCLLRVSCPR